MGFCCFWSVLKMLVYQSVCQGLDTSLPFDVKGELLASINALHVEQLKERAAECHLPQPLLT